MIHPDQMRDPNVIHSPWEICGIFAFPASLLLIVLVLYLIDRLRRRHYRLTTTDFRGIATVTSHKYVPSRRSGAMVHSTSPAKYYIYYETADFCWRLNSEDLYHFLEDGDRFELEGRLTMRGPKDAASAPVFEKFEREVVRKLRTSREP